MEIMINSPREVFTADKQREIKDAYISGIKMADIEIKMKFAPSLALRNLIMNDVKRIKTNIEKEYKNAK